ncbi:MAG: DUF2000 domain-containing protein [Acetatifactor sp.]|nr:DUF2000 domain-containing protein [Acetatifactor sp.]MDE7113890.1 DUF2000 domain-containing protein [Acetatifactor sp.]
MDLQNEKCVIVIDGGAKKKVNKLTGSMALLR